jgi:phosphoglycolate phosphatase-like HAD superfamily hydrolase
MSKPKAVIIDLDGTLCDLAHRLHYVEKSPKDWDSFFNEAYKDTPFEWCQDLISGLMSIGYAIIFITGRAERKISLEWLCRHTQIPRQQIDERLYTREKGDFRKDHEVKAELYRNHIEPHFRVVFAVDDKKSIVDLWRSLGIPALLCSDWEEKKPANTHETLEMMKEHQKKSV